MPSLKEYDKTVLQNFLVAETKRPQTSFLSTSSSINNHEYFGVGIVYGSMAHHINTNNRRGDLRAAPGQPTHRWVIYVRSPNDENISEYIEKVSFSLHSSFAEPVRTVTKPPFEVTENGWGEFEAMIRIFFKDPSQEPVDIHHVLRLYHTKDVIANAKKPVVSEFYDEIVFTDPPPLFRRLLLLQKPGTAPVDATSLALPALRLSFDEAADLQRLGEIRAHVTKELQRAKSQLLSLELESATGTQTAISTILPLPVTAAAGNSNSITNYNSYGEVRTNTDNQQSLVRGSNIGSGSGGGNSSSGVGLKRKSHTRLST